MLRLIPAMLLAALTGLPVEAAEPPDFASQVAPILEKYCTVCHAGSEPEGELRLDTYDALMKGGSSGPAVIPGNVEKSRLLLLVERQAEPFMPPEDNEAPTEQEIAILKAWVESGAKGPKGQMPDIPRPKVPKIVPTAPVRDAITAAAWSPDGRWVAVARFGKVEIYDAGGTDRDKAVRSLAVPAGQVNAVVFSRDGRVLCAAGGEPSLAGEVRVWSVQDDFAIVRDLRGHLDSIYSADISPDGRLLATGSYDRTILIWNLEDGEVVRKLKGHNGPIFDVAFHPQGRLLASASGDRTVKLWDVSAGKRLDTFVQPTKAQHTVTFSPDGRFIAAGGVDNRIRVWEITSNGREGTNPIRYARFAHEEPILALAFAPNGKSLVSAGQDRLIKVWETGSFTLATTLAAQPDWPEAISVGPTSQKLLVGRLDGTWALLDLPAEERLTAQNRARPILVEPLPESHHPLPRDQWAQVDEIEPNDEPALATPLPLPGEARGRLWADDGRPQDFDHYRIQASRGETWILETVAAREKSPADTLIEVLHADGRPVKRLLLQAIRDSYITFRPIDSRQTQVRVKNWEEMRLNQYVYMAGEVCRIIRMPQGPDSGILFYDVNGQRRCYFDTSPTVHALGDPIYIVEAYPPETQPLPNGLPAFPLFYANDDDGDRQLGADSRLRFTAPEDGTYVIRVRDTRGFSGEKFHYRLIVRPPNPCFRVTVTPRNPTIPAGSGQRLIVKVDRRDGFEGPVRVDFAHVPPGFQIATPVVIEAGHREARTVLTAAPNASPPSQEQWEKLAITASASVHGREVRQEVGHLGEIKVGPAPKFVVFLEPAPEAESASETGSTPELVIAPGTTIPALLRIERNNFDGEIRFDVDNLPHGVIVDNLGLNGIMIRAKETQRRIFITAESWVPETTRWVHAVARSQGNQASAPIRLRVVRAADVASTGPTEN